MNYYKIILCGDFGCGKTSLMNRYLTGEFDQYCSATIGASFQEKCIKTENIRIGIWDTAGQERYHSLLPMYFRGADVMLYCISWDTMFNERVITNFIKDFKTYNETAKIYVIVTKRDLGETNSRSESKLDEVPVRINCSKSKLELEQFCTQWNYPVYYTSALKNIGVNTAFDHVIDYLKTLEPVQKIGVELGYPKKTTNCCWN